MQQYCETKVAMKLLLLLTTFLVVPQAELTISFDGWKVFRVMINSAQDKATLLNLDGDQNYIFWTSIYNTGSEFDIMVISSKADAFPSHFTDSIVTVLIDNVQDVINDEKPGVKQRSGNGGSMSWDDYYSYSEINQWLQALVTEFPDKVTIIEAGKSYEGRAIVGVRVSFSTVNANTSIFVEAGIHGREWITVATLTYLLNEVLRSTNPAVREMAEDHDWYFFPVTNPDGYDYTFTTNRMWRKNRNPNDNQCIGVDTNRNWGYNWLNGTDPCSDAYPGNAPFSEPESQAMSALLGTLCPKLLSFISFHAYSQMLLLPYGDSPDPRDNYNELYPILGQVAQKIQEIQNTEYTYGNIMNTLYRANGNDIDWVKATCKSRVSIGWELGYKDMGFLVPASQIVQSGKETLTGFVALHNALKSS